MGSKPIEIDEITAHPGPMANAHKLLEVLNGLRSRVTVLDGKERSLNDVVAENQKRIWELELRVAQLDSTDRIPLDSVSDAKDPPIHWSNVVYFGGSPQSALDELVRMVMVDTSDASFHISAKTGEETRHRIMDLIRTFRKQLGL